MTSSLRSQVSALFVARLVAAALQAATGLLFARAVLPSTFGVVAAVAGVLVFVAVIGDLGMSSTLGRLRARGRTTSVRTGLTLSTLLLTVAAGLSSLVIAFSPLPPGLTGVLWLLALGGMLDRNVDAGLAILVADRQRAAPAVSVVLRRAVTAVGFGALALSGVDAVVAYSLAMAAGPMVGWAHMYAKLRSLGLGLPRLEGAGETLKESAPFAVNDVSTQARSLDVALIASVASPVPAGLFAAASRLTSPVHLISGTLASVVLPRAAEMDRAGVHRLGTKMVGLALFATAVSTPTFLVSDSIIVVLLGPEYAAAGPALAWLLVGLPLAVLVAPLSALLQAVDAAGVVARGSAVYSVLVLAGVAIGAVAAGAVGAAVAGALLPAARSAVLIWTLRRRCGVPMLGRHDVNEEV